MFERVGGRDGAECLDVHIAERAAAGGERDAAYARVRVALEALENSVVLAVDGQNFRAALKDSGHVIPGIGGMFDLSDSLLLTAPVAYFLFRLP